MIDSNVMPDDLLDRYLKDPVKLDSEVRQRMKILPTRYYTVSVWPMAGVVTVDSRVRVVSTPKISKSDNK